MDNPYACRLRLVAKTYLPLSTNIFICKIAWFYIYRTLFFYLTSFAMVSLVKLLCAGRQFSFSFVSSQAPTHFLNKGQLEHYVKNMFSLWFFCALIAGREIFLRVYFEFAKVSGWTWFFSCFHNLSIIHTLCHIYPRLTTRSRCLDKEFQYFLPVVLDPRSDIFAGRTPQAQHFHLLLRSTSSPHPHRGTLWFLIRPPWHTLSLRTVRQGLVTWLRVLLSEWGFKDIFQVKKYLSGQVENVG